MGLFTVLLTLPLAPVRGVTWVVDQVAQETERELYDEDRLRAQLLQLEIESDDGVIDDEERHEREEELLERLAIARQRAAEEEAADQEPMFIESFRGEDRDQSLRGENRNG